MDDERRHEVRKDAKKFRHAAEFFTSLFDDKRGRDGPKIFCLPWRHCRTN
ncbi:CHAD domain-containing protein [Rhizobium sp. P28RR-XV]|nr:CHAD domain-containing protein [Rhizobium sp. P28RR-XV]